MDETVVCPDCEAQLVLPSLPAGQTVQCPRCRRVFEPFRQRGRAPVAAPPPVVVEDDSFELPRDIDRPMPLRGEKVGMVATWLIGACCLLGAIQLYSHIETARVMENLLNGGGGLAAGERADRLSDLEEQAQTISSLMHFAAVPTIIIYLIWLYGASCNLSNLKTAGVRHTPGGTVWMHFFPIANLVFPYLALQEIWRASDPERVEGPRSWQQAPASSLIRACWFCGFLAWLSAFIGSLSYSGHHLAMRRFHVILLDEMRHQREGVWFYAAANLAAIITGILFILIIRGLTQRQRDRHNEVYRG